MDRWARAFILIECKRTEPSNACQTASLHDAITTKKKGTWAKKWTWISTEDVTFSRRRHKQRQHFCAVMHILIYLLSALSLSGFIGEHIQRDASLQTPSLKRNEVFTSYLFIFLSESDRVVTKSDPNVAGWVQLMYAEALSPCSPVRKSPN